MKASSSGMIVVSLALTAAFAISTSAQYSPEHRHWPGPGHLFVGTCYQPIDRSPEQIDHDIALMKRAGFNVVRMGDLSWDSFEPSQGKFNFGWFDTIMDKMQVAGIRVILDIPGTPAPIWLHRAYPGVDIIAQNGSRLPPAERYMDDISDPDYVREAEVLADTMTKRYAHHPAVIAVGYDNEIGNGFMSYSEADRQRFIAWLKKKYGTIEDLNKAWATQRWSRRLNSFDDVDLPLADGPGPSERYLDLHRYWSDVKWRGLKNWKRFGAEICRKFHRSPTCGTPLPVVASIIFPHTNPMFPMVRKAFIRVIRSAARSAR